MRRALPIIIAAALTLASTAPAPAQVSTPPRGSSQRTAILDTVRPVVESELGKPVEFVVNDIRLLGEWAFVSLTPQRPGGGKVEYAYTRYQTAVDNDMFGNTVSALLRQTPKGWLVYEYDLGATDVVWLQWKEFYPVPPEVFPGAMTGLAVRPGYFDRAAQEWLVAALRDAEAAAPFFTPTMPRTGKPFSVRMTNLGPLGWVSDREHGYRYQPTHPETGRPWPPIPETVLAVWREVSGYPHDPEACLVNRYEPGARMGLHQDRDEKDFAAPVVSISLGDTCLFRIGGTKRDDATRSLKLSSGDVVVLGGESRLAFHGVDRLYPGTSTLLSGWFPEGGRINLTLRRVSPP